VNVRETATISTSSVRVFRDPPSRSEAFKAISATGAPRTQRQILGDRLRNFGHQVRAGPEGGIPIRQPRHHAGLRVFKKRGGGPRFKERACAARQYACGPSEEMNNKQIFYGQYKRVQDFGAPVGLLRPDRRPELAILERLRDKVAARGLHHSVCQSGRRHARAGAHQSARGTGAVARGGYEVRNQKSSNTRPANRSWSIPGGPPNFREASRCFLSPRSRAWRHRPG